MPTPTARANYLTIFTYKDSSYYTERKKEVTVKVGEYAVIREDGKYSSITEEELKDWYREDWNE